MIMIHPYDVLLGAVARGDVRALGALSPDFVRASGLMRAAAAARDRDGICVLRWARRALRMPWDPAVTWIAYTENRARLLRWAARHGCPLHPRVMVEAAERGDLDTIRWAAANGCAWNPAATEVAAERGDLRMLRWLVRRGCPWGDTALVDAARAGRLDILQWALAHGCAWDPRVVLAAMAHRHPAILAWSRESGYYSDDTL